tara:strand:+ start:155 stop:286 length:132 start_codon:yes stop_codon:yes gene_type:complete
MIDVLLVTAAVSANAIATVARAGGSNHEGARFLCGRALLATKL